MEGGAAAVAHQMAEGGGLCHVVRRLRSSNPSVRTCESACSTSACAGLGPGFWVQFQSSSPVMARAWVMATATATSRASVRANYLCFAFRSRRRQA